MEVPRMVPVALANCDLQLQGETAHVRLWSRADLTPTQCADNVSAVASRAAQGAQSATVKRLVVDLAEAPPVLGPIGQEALGRMYKAWEREHKRIVIFTSANATQELQQRRLQREHAPIRGMVARKA